MSDLLRVLSNFQDALGHARAEKGALTDFKTFALTLSRFEQLSVQEFCRLCDQIDAGATRQVENHPAVQGPSAAVEAYMQKLAVAQEKPAFEAVLAELRADKNLKTGDLSEIARRFVGGTSKYSKKADAYKAIELRFEAHRRAVNRLDAASGIF